MALVTTLQQVAQVLSQEWTYPPQQTPTDLDQSLQDKTITGITTDSRFIQPGNLFLALEGESFDGHTFVAQALQSGAIAAIVSQQKVTTLQSNPDIHRPLLAVPDTLVAYQEIATWWRHQCNPAVIAITGSVGKTTTKELIAAVLSTDGHVLKTQANYNNEIGVPKTLLELEPNHDYAVVEMGMRAQGEIAVLTQIAQPDIAVITNVGTAHIGRLGSEEAIAQAKCELLSHLSDSGIAILNADNPLLIHTAQGVWKGKTITFGLDKGDVRGTVINADTISVDDTLLPLPLPGRHNALNYLAAIAVTQVLGLDQSRLNREISVDLPSGRARRHTLPNDVVILDETYNAGFESMTAALQLLADVPGKRHIAVLGTMKELGDRSVDLHHRVGQVVHRLKLDHLFILADPDERIALQKGAGSIPSEWFEDHASLIQRLQEWVMPGDRILFKASRSVALDQVVTGVLERLS